MIDLAGSVTSQIRNAINHAMKTFFRDESMRKKTVESYYAWRLSRINRSSPLATHLASDLIDWRKTLSFRFSCSRGVYRGNSFYGAASAMETYAHAQSSMKACIEHGVYFGDYVNEAELDGSGLPCLVTFGEVRREHIKSHSDVPVAMVGPYISYSERYLDDEEHGALKNKLGKTLLVFPSHSIDRVKVEYETNALIEGINSVAKKCDVESILVCLYYRDLLNGHAKEYEEAGYTVVTAGYREDPLFLSRLKTLIQLADISMSNSVGTHVGYCVYLGTPHYILPQEKYFASASSADKREISNSFDKASVHEKTEIEHAFSIPAELLTMEQKAVCDKYWGFSHVLSRDEMLRLINACDNAYSAKPCNRQKVLRGLCSNPDCGIGELIG